MRKTKRFKQVVAVLLPVLFLLGMVFTFPKGSSLKADDSEQPFAKVKLAGKTETLTDIVVKDNLVEVELTGKKTELIQLPDNPSYAVFQMNEEGNQLTTAEKRMEEMDDLLKQTSSDSSDSLEEKQKTEGSSTKETETTDIPEEITPELFHVAGKKKEEGRTYFQLVEGKPLTFTIERKSNAAIPIILTASQGEEVNQRLFTFEAVTSTETTSSSKKMNSSEINEQAQTSIEASSASENQSEPSSEPEQAKQSAPPSEEEKSTEEASSPKQEDSEKPETYDHVLKVETKATKKTLEELTAANYGEADSLKTPVFLEDETKKTPVIETKAESPIIVRDAKLTTKTGTASFDINNDPGNDASENNDIVRTFDQIGYLASFSIQNTKVDTKYTNIRYRVITEMPNAVEVLAGIPRNNGEIANGRYINTPKGDGSQVSEGVMESVITDSGQVFVPIILNVYGSTHGKQIQPTIKLEIVEAKNTQTGKVETFNKVYDLNSLPSLKTPITKVSAKPSVKVDLVKGEQTDFQIYKPGATNTDKVYDVGVTVRLTALPGRKDMKGTTYPTGPIEFKINQAVTSKKGATISNVPKTQYTSANTRFYSVTNTQRPQANWVAIGDGVPWKGTFDSSKLKKPLPVPNGRTKEIYTSIPTTDLKKVGVYDSGNLSVVNGSYQDTVKVENYAGTRNPYTYTTNGERYSSDSFISGELIVNYYDKSLNDLAKKNGWESYTLNLSVDSVSYNGMTTANTTSIEYPTIVTASGAYAGGPTFTKQVSSETGAIEGLNDAQRPGYHLNSGNAQLYEGSKIYISGFPNTANQQVTNMKQIFMWDPTAFEYDVTRETYYGPDGFSRIESSGFSYGVSKNLSSSAPYTMKVSDIDIESSKYTWYKTPEEAKTHGKISAVLSSVAFKTGSNGAVFPAIPVTVIGKPGSKTPAGNPYVALMTSNFTDNNNGGKVLYQQPAKGTVMEYKPTTYTSDGRVFSKPSSYWNWLGETAFVRGFNITTQTDVYKDVYQTNEDIDLKVTGMMTGSDTEVYDSALTTTLPKGISYKRNSSKDALKTPLPEPYITTNADGTTNLRWVFTKMTNDQRKRGIEVNFQATSDFTKLPFKDSGYTDSLIVKTIGEMWVNGNPTIKDTTQAVSRSSQDDFIAFLIQQVILTKSANKPLIEVGDIDDAVSGGKVNNSIVYTISLKNESASPIPNLRLVDFLPYNNDSRGSKISGNYQIETVFFNDLDTKIQYTNTAASSTLNENTDPMSIPSNWATYYAPGGTLNPDIIKNAKAFLISKPSLGVGEEISLSIVMKPTNQVAGDVFVNNANMNSNLNLPVQSQAVWTRVYGRDLTGVAWYDDDKNGFMNAVEPKAKDIPVKLYRTSLAKPTYKDQLVKSSLTGENFVDAAGNSTVKTDVNGKYTFKNLPEGNYVAEFVIGGRVTAKEFSVTTPNATGDVTKNSKANQTTYKTPAYKEPLLTDLPTNTTATDPVYHVQYVNLGLVRLNEKLTIKKTVDKSLIEVGDVDPTGVNGLIDNSITYTVTVKNEGNGDVPNVKILDVLPYLSDSRKTTLTGDYTVQSIAVNSPTAKIAYNTNPTVNEAWDPNTLAWASYTPGTNIEKATAFVISEPLLKVGASLNITIKIKPTKQKSGELIANDASMNNGLNGGANTPVRSNIVTTKVYGRDFTGVAWYDDNKNGLMDAAEPKAKEIPVKLHRKSLAKPTLDWFQVKSSLTGESFVDAAGNSTVKTDANGKYTFRNLPEGNYVAEFMIGDRVTAKEFSVTTPNVGTDVTKNSKANQTTYKTLSSKQPLLADLPTNTTATDPVYHVKDVNLGVVRLTQKLSITKQLDKTAIEVGNNDLAETSGKIDNSITYTITVKNNEAAKIPNVHLLDALPYINDTRGTTLAGDYSVQSILVNDPSVKIKVSGTKISPGSDPNKVDTTNWVANPTASSMAGAKTIFITKESLDAGGVIELKIKLAPTGQISGNLIKNDSIVNSGLNGGTNAPIRSNIVTTKVYGRDLTGVAWYDDNKDGLIGKRVGGSDEPFAKDIPVKLYRTSLAKPTYKDQLVKSSLTGENFVDTAGNSTVKTDANGKYTFRNLPEGNYVAEFVIGGRVTAKEFSVTTPNVGTDVTKNSKANQTTYKTAAYKQPLLADLPTSTTATDPIYHVQHINIGLIRLTEKLNITKTVDRSSIEVGDMDPTGVNGLIDNSITYTVRVTNEGKASVPLTRLLDVLPYLNDSRGTTTKSTQVLTSIKVNSPGVTTVTKYTTTKVDDKLNPNSIPLDTWGTYTPGTTPMTELKDAKAILIATSSLPEGKYIELQVTIKLVNQISGELIKNDAAVNTALNGGANAPIRSNIVTTKVYSRILSGIAWYDDDKDGLMHPTSEGKVKDIPVKLYRTSLAKPAYKDQLVKTSLTGESFVDAAGNSTVKTDVNGKYVFTNLPEGNYVAEFMIGSRVTAKEISVTTPNVGTDPAKNSKASQTTFKTPAYKQPLLADLPTNTTATNAVYHVPNLHIGLIRTKNPLSITKTLDRKEIEVGDEDPIGAAGKIDNTITYTVKVTNTGDASIPGVRLVDVLPYVKDSRGTTLSGAYTVEDLTVNDSTIWLGYSNTAMADNIDPNIAGGFSEYIPGTTSKETIKNAKAIIAIKWLAPGASIEMKITIKPVRQKTGELIKNDAAVNTGLNGGANAPIRSNVVTTKVYGRDFTGIAWYDDKKDGLMDAWEPKAKDIPVRLYRKSLVNPTLDWFQVKSSLTGERFVDDAGHSTVKTDANGKYTFRNLPEGNYGVEFLIGDRVIAKEFSVTTPNVGTDVTKNSKANQTTYKTPSSKQPLLADLPTNTTATDPVYHIQHMNIGLVRTTNPLSITKTLDRKEIEVGDEDPTGVAGKIDNTITYTVKVTNTGDVSVPSVRLLDVLPYLKDSRGTTFNGTYTIENLTINDSTAWLGYSNSLIADNIDPNRPGVFSKYTPGVSSVEEIKNAKSILAIKDLAAGASIEIKITIKPVNQKTGELLKNDAAANTALNDGANAPIRSNIVTTKVYGRDFTGVAWYDENKNGLMDATEAKVKDIPVKLYRTSLAKPTYKDQLVKTSLTGESFIDAAGNSTVKTDANGKYIFRNLPEGNYVAEFVIGDRVAAKEFGVTVPNAGTDPTKNSKASQTTYKTPAYKEPLLADLPTSTTVADPVHHVKEVHLGLVFPWSIQLFKYIAGTAVDANNDGHLSDVEKATGTPLEGAEFTIYKGTEVNDAAKVGSATTNKDGKLTFDFLYELDYVLVETKAPVGYELIKEPIHVRSKGSNQTVMVYQEDEPVTKLPFTGGNGPVRLFLLTTGSLFLVGLVGIAWYYRTPRKKGER